MKPNAEMQFPGSVEMESWNISGSFHKSENVRLFPSVGISRASVMKLALLFN